MMNLRGSTRESSNLIIPLPPSCAVASCILLGNPGPCNTGCLLSSLSGHGLCLPPGSLTLE
ncbi:hypothetical protein L208DRAFT_1453270 [Tricholoma matsutake]|nr:hypothetical protein L208DRAFT_1453270 [Tricholoma matsutake 945]